jgi:NAD(P)-dependent dehydrogenase (short-subunit alcohol dehydrogenase family)
VERYDLAGQVALVTGGVTGIGRAMAEALGTVGAKVWIASRDENAIDLAVDQLRARGLAVNGRRLDVTERGQIDAVVSEVIGQDGRIDILFNGAGVMIKYPVLAMPEEIWDQVVDVNLKGMFLCTQAVARGMIARGYGRIINVSSGHVRGNATNSAYSAAKGGLESFTKTFAAELNQLKVDVTINAIEPGGTDTPMWRRGKSAAYITRALESGRIHQPDYMRDVVLYLASAASRAVNGEIVSHNQRDRLATQISG